MAIDDVDAIERAVIETNREIAAEAWDQEAVELDHTGDRTPETVGEGLEGQVENDEAEETETEEVEAEAAETAEGETAEPGKEKPATEVPKPAVREPEGRVPPGRLREATEKARALEAERDKLKTELATTQTTSKQEIAALNARLDGVLTAIKQQQQPPRSEAKPEAEVVPDMFEDPKGYQDYQDRKNNERLAPIVQQLQNQRVETSMMLAHATHKETFEKAIGELQKLNPQNPDDRATVQRIYASPNPGQALVDWHQRNETLREVGNDPAKYREKIAADAKAALLADPEFRKQVIADLQAEANGNGTGRPNTITRLPKSLNGAPGGSRAGIASETFDGSPQAVADSAWRD